MSELHRETPLFDKFLPIEVVERGAESLAAHSSGGSGIGTGSSIVFSGGSSGSSASEFSKQSTLVCRLLHGTQPTASLSHTERVLHIEVTDEQDPYFLYYLDVGEHEFHHLKRDQSILVDFGVFPMKLIELIELCLRKPRFTEDTSSASSIVLGEISASINTAAAATNLQHQMHAQLQESPPQSPPSTQQQQQQQQEQWMGGNNSMNISTYIAKLCTNKDDRTGIFSIVEANKFKQLTHISLRLKAADDAAIKAYLASRLSLALSVGKRQAARINHLDERLIAAEQRGSSMQQELHSLSTRSSVDVQSLRSEHAQQLAEAQRAAMENVENLRQRHEQQLQSVRSQLEAAQSEAHERISNYEQQVADLNFSKGQLEFKLRDVERLLANTEAERERMMKEWEVVSAHRREVEEERTALQRDVVRLESRVEVLSAQLQERDESMSKSLALQKASEEARSAVEQRLQMYMSNAEVLQENLRVGAGEIEKGNDIIAKLQAEVKSLRDKVKMKSEVIRRQEAGVTEMRLKLADFEHALSTKRDAEQTALLKISNLQNQLDDANDRLQQNSKVIAGNKEVIAYLNEEINKWQLGMRVTTEPQMSNVLHSLHTVTPPAGNTAAFDPATPDNYSYNFNAQQHFGSASTQPLQQQHSSPEMKVSFVQSDRYISNTSGSKYMEDVYKQGIQNLGLGDSEFSEKDYDWLQAMHSPNVSMDAARAAAGATTSAASDLEQLDYYATTSSSPGRGGATVGRGVQQLKPSRLPTRSGATPSSGKSQSQSQVKSAVSSTGHRVASAVSAARASVLSQHMDEQLAPASRAAAATPAGERRYSWQSPDFGLVDSH